MKVFVGSASKYKSESFIIASLRAFSKKVVDERDIYKTELGKPFFKDKDLPLFSVSHSGEYIVCVFDDDIIGVDIQKIKLIPNGVAKRYLKTDSQEPVQKTIEWTKFESYGKMIGTGVPYEEDYSKGHFLLSKKIQNYILTICTKKECKQELELVFI